jgi:hypothetical protein
MGRSGYEWLSPEIKEILIIRLRYVVIISFVIRGPIVCPETSVTINQRCVISQKGEDLYELLYSFKCIYSNTRKQCIVVKCVGHRKV